MGSNSSLLAASVGASIALIVALASHYMQHRFSLKRENTERYRTRAEEDRKVVVELSEKLYEWKTNVECLDILSEDTSAREDWHEKVIVGLDDILRALFSAELLLRNPAMGEILYAIKRQIRPILGELPTPSPHVPHTAIDNDVKREITQPWRTEQTLLYKEIEKFDAECRRLLHAANTWNGKP